MFTAAGILSTVFACLLGVTLVAGSCSARHGEVSGRRRDARAHARR